MANHTTGTRAADGVQDRMRRANSCCAHRSESGSIHGNRTVTTRKSSVAIRITLTHGTTTTTGGGATTTTTPGSTTTTTPGSTTSTTLGTGTTLPTDPAQLIALANSLYQQALQAQRDGDWAEYGQLIDRLGQVLAAL